MHPSAMETVWQRMERTADALRKNNMEATCVKTAQDVVPVVRSLLHPGDVVSNGGSVSLAETGVMDLLRSGEYRFLDREGLSGDELGRVYRDAFSADAYFASANAVTDAGEIFNVDGNGNRVAAIAFGPKKVILVVGCNKLVADLREAETRLETLAAPANTKRLSCATPCRETGVCAHCHSPARVCCTYTVQRFQRQKGRIHVILVAEPLGF